MISITDNQPKKSNEDKIRYEKEFYLKMYSEYWNNIRTATESSWKIFLSYSVIIGIISFLFNNNLAGWIITLLIIGFTAITISITLNSNLWFLRNIIFISRVEAIFDVNKVLPKEYKKFKKRFINDEIFTLHLILYLIICIFLTLFFIFQLKSWLELTYILIGTGLIVAAVIYYSYHLYKRYDKHRNPQKYQK